MANLGILNGFKIYSSNIMNNSYNDRKWKEIRKCNDFLKYCKDKYENNDTSDIIEIIDDHRVTEYRRLISITKKMVWDKYWKKYNFEHNENGIWKYMNDKSIDPLDKQWLIDFMEKEGFGKFRNWVMVNISPKWNNIDQINWKKQSMFLKQIIINRFQKWDRYVDKCEFVLEPGKSGDHLHAHILLRCSKTFNEKSFKTWINKGNLVQQFRAEFVEPRSGESRCKGFEGDVGSRYSFQTKLILNEEIFEDTLNYLSEEHKSDDHANDFTYMPFLPLRVSL